MAYSNTISQTTFTTDRVLRSAVRRCKVPAEQLSSDDWSIAQDELFLLLGSLANMGVPLWAIQKQLYAMYEGQGALTLDVGTVDVLNSFFRRSSELTGTDTDTSTTHTVEFDSATGVSVVGILWTATAVPIALERSDDGVTWETVQSETPTASAGQKTWFDLDSVVAATWFRVRATSGTLSFDAVYLGNNPYQIPLARLNRDDWTNLPNPAFTSQQPLQYWFDRQVSQPVMRFWPLPNLQATSAQIVVWRHRQIMDVGTLTQEIEVPQRWYDAIVAGLAARLGRELIQVDAAIIPQLDSDAAVAMNYAQAEEYDDSPMRIAPNISMYTA